MSADVEIRVHRLVLHDIEPQAHAAVIAELRSELSRLLADDPPRRVASHREVEARLDSSENDPRLLGINAARAVHRELSR